jgi:hypothetical protein
MTNPDQIQVVVGAPGPVQVVDVFHQGPQGQTGSVTFLKYFADGTISGHRVVRATADGKVGYASSANPGDAQLIIGISMNAAADGDTVNVHYIGPITEPSWAWAPNMPVYCGIDGALTQTPPTSGFILIIGAAISATAIFFDQKIAIILS